MNASEINAERIKAIKEEEQKGEEIQKILDKYFPGASLEAINRAWFVYEQHVQYIYEADAIEQPVSLRDYLTALGDKAMDATMENDPNAEEINKDFERFCDLI